MHYMQDKTIISLNKCPFQKYNIKQTQKVGCYNDFMFCWSRSFLLKGFLAVPSEKLRSAFKCRSIFLTYFKSSEFTKSQWLWQFVSISRMLRLPPCLLFFFFILQNYINWNLYFSSPLWFEGNILLNKISSRPFLCVKQLSPDS